MSPNTCQSSVRAKHLTRVSIDLHRNILEMMDCRVKPGNDVWGNCGSSKPRTRSSRRCGPYCQAQEHHVAARSAARRNFDSNFKQQVHVGISRRDAPEVCVSWSLKQEGAGNAGCALHPRSRVQNRQRKRTRAYRFSGGTPTFPAQWLYGLLRALPGESGFVVSVACE
jgi:hypothetical protein